MDESAGYRISEDQSAGVLEIVHLDQPIALADFTPERSARCSIFDVDPLLSGRNHRSAAQQWRELSDRLNGRVNLESQLLGNFSGAALNPKCPQPGRCGADSIPVIRRDEAKLGVGYFQALASEIGYTWADLEYLHLLHADDFVEQLPDAGALRRRLQHFGLAVGQDCKLDPLLVQCFETRLDVREGRKPQIGVHQLLLFVGR